MGYDTVQHEAVLFGGGGTTYNQADPINDTWVFQNGTWENVTATAGTPPSPRGGASLVYDGRDGFLDLLGGLKASQTYNWNDSVNCWAWCNDSWEFHQGQWTQLPVPASNPFENFTANGSEVLYEGSTAAYDSTNGYVMLLSNYFPRNDSRLNITRAETWSIAGSNWTDLSSNSTVNATLFTPNFFDPVLADDPGAGGVLLFGGDYYTYNGAIGELPSDATWFYSGGVWSNVSGDSALAPPPLAYATELNLGQSMSYDSATQSVVLFDRGTTWMWKDMNWTNVTPAQSPPTYGPAMTWDQAVNATVIFGGSSSNGERFYNATWEWTTRPGISDLSIQAVPDPVLVGSPVAFNDSLQGGVPTFNYSWNFGDGATSSAATPAHSFSAAGNYTVRLNLSDSAGHSGTATTVIFVGSIPALTPRVSPNPTDVGLPTAFFAGASGGIDSRGGAIQWKFGDTTDPNSSNETNRSSAPDPVHTYFASGSYSPTVWWNFSEGNGSNGTGLVKTLSLRVNPPLATPLIVASPTTPDLGELVNFTATETGGTAPYVYSWVFGDGGTGGDLANISHIFTTNGPFTASVNVTDAAGAGVTGFLQLAVALNLSVLPNATLGAAPFPVGFVSHVHGGSGTYQYAWSFGDGATSQSADPSHVYVEPGSFVATLVVTDGAGKQVDSNSTILVLTGGGSLTTLLSVSAGNIPLGSSVILTAQVHGGAGRLTVAWPIAPYGCVESGPLTLDCSPNAAGQFNVSVQVGDATGSRSTSSATFTVGGGGNLVTPPLIRLVPNGFPLLDVLSIAVVAAAILGSAGYVVGRRRGNEGPPQAESPRDQYSGYRAASPARAAPPTAEQKASLEDIF